MKSLIKRILSWVKEYFSLLPNDQINDKFTKSSNSALMMLPKNGNIVVVDNKYEEVEELLQALYSQGYSCRYYNGDMDSLPSENVVSQSSVRVLILDLNLTTDTEETRVVSALVSVINRIIPDNCPYILLVWSTRENEYLGKLNEAFDKEPLNSKRPLSKPITIQKNKFIGLDSEKKMESSSIVEELILIITNALENSSSFLTLLAWENLVGSASNTVVNDVSSLAPHGESWNSEMEKILFFLAKAAMGKHVKNAENEALIVSAFSAINSSFQDSLDKKTVESKEEIPGNIPEATDTLLPTIISNINNKLLTLDGPLTDIHPGNVYMIREEEPLNYYKEMAKNDMFDRKKIAAEFEQGGESKSQSKRRTSALIKDLVDKAQFVELDITPMCDFSQKKNTSISVLPGVIFPVEERGRIQVKGSNYLTPNISLASVDSFIIFDFKYLKVKSLESFADLEAFFRLRHSLLVDIQSHFSSHISRPGIMSL